MKNLINEDIQNMKYLLGYKPGKVLSEQGTPSISTSTPSPTPAPATPAAATTPQEVIKQIQTVLNTKYGAKLTVDGKWGNLTQTAFEAAVKNIKPATAGGTTPAPVAGGTTSAPVVSGGTTSSPVVSGGTTTYTGEDVSDIVGPEKEPQLNQGSQQALSGQLTPQQIRQQARFDQRLARQARRNTRRAGQQ